MKKKGWFIAQRESSLLERDLATKCTTDLNTVLQRNFGVMIAAKMKETDAYSMVLMSLVTMLTVVAKHLGIPEYIVKTYVANAFKTIDGPEE
jgi:hypothetical protein